MDTPKRLYFPLNDETAPEAVVVHCSAPRFQDAFQGFVKTELKIAHYAPIIIPGSVSSVSLDLAMPKRLKALRDYVEFMVDQVPSRRIVIINHEDCRMYASLSKFFRQIIPTQQILDLGKAAKLFSNWLPVLRQIELYMAKISTNGQIAASEAAKKSVYFEKVVF